MSGIFSSRMPTSTGLTVSVTGFRSTSITGSFSTYMW